jgi:hypothetical protein
MRNLSEILNDMEMLEMMKNDIYSDEYIDPNEKDMILTDIDLSLDCLACCLMYGDYINDTGEEFDYWSI